MRQVLIHSRLCPVSNSLARNRVYVSLNTPIVCPPEYDMFATIVDCQIPNTIFNIMAPDNVVNMSLRYGTLGTRSFQWVIPNGNYTLDSLGAKMAQTVFEFKNYGASTLANVKLAFTLAKTDFNVLTLKFVPTTTGTITGAGVSPVFTVMLGNASILGFNPGTVLTANAVATQANDIPPFIRKYYVIASTLGSSSQIPATGYELALHPIGKIPATVSYGYTEMYTNNSSAGVKISDRFIDNFQIALLDEYGTDVSLNYNDWSITLQIDVQPKLKTFFSESLVNEQTDR